MKHLDADRIQRQLDLEFAYNIHVYDELPSTNDWALASGQHADCCLAEKQSHGRGRRGRRWVSPNNGNIYLSVCWCFDAVPEFLTSLSLLVGVSVCESLQQQGLQKHGLKWPNDILYQGRKLAGILIETRDQLHTVVIGLGLNVNPVAPDSANHKTSWGSLQQFMPKVPDRNALVACLLNGLGDCLSRFQQLQFQDIQSKWQQWDLLQGKTVHLINADKHYQGTVAGIDKQGRILLQQAQGCRAFSSAEVSLRW